jgi:hypothetical protein
MNRLETISRTGHTGIETIHFSTTFDRMRAKNTVSHRIYCIN